MAKHIHIHVGKKTSDRKVRDGLKEDYLEWAKSKGKDPQSRITFKQYVRANGVNPAEEARLEKEARIGSAARDSPSLGTGTLKYRVAKRGGGMWDAGTKIKILRSVGSGLFQIELPDGDMERVGSSSIDNYEAVK